MRTIFNHFLYCSLTILIVLSCKKLEKIAKLPTVYLIGASKTTNTTIEVLGQFTWDGDSPILSKGLCYGLKENPTISDSTLEIKEDVSDFKSTITGLTKDTKYYIRLFAKNIAGITYSEQVNIKTANILPTAPILTSIDADSITTTSAKLGGNINSDGGEPVIERGIILSTVQIPSNKDSIITCGTGIGSFSKVINKLKPVTKYYFRVYAKNAIGIAYSSIKIFTTEPPITGYGPILTDIDGNEYKTVYINKQHWMAENLKVTRYSNGDSLNKNNYGFYNNDKNNNLIYGKLYNYSIAISNKNVCPTGWKVPSDTEWKQLLDYLKLNTDAYSIFNPIMGGGYEDWSMKFSGITNSALYWSNHPNAYYNDFMQAKFYSSNSFYFNGSSGPAGYSSSANDKVSIRCVRK